MVQFFLLNCAQGPDFIAEYKKYKNVGHWIKIMFNLHNFIRIIWHKCIYQLLFDVQSATTRSQPTMSRSHLEVKCFKFLFSCQLFILKVLKSFVFFKDNLVQMFVIITWCAEPNNLVTISKVKVTFKGHMFKKKFFLSTLKLKLQKKIKKKLGSND